MLLRIKLFVLFCFLGFSFLLVRLFYWQIYKGSELSIQARGQQQFGITLNAPRGEILASDGSWLAASTDAWLVYANLPDLDEDASTIADKITPLFIEDYEDDTAFLKEAGRIKELLGKRGLVWVPLKQKVGSETKKNIEALN